jgi:hypothetical protein
MKQGMRPFLCCAAVLVVAGLAINRVNAQDRGTPAPGAIPQNIPPAISQKTSVPSLQLSQAQQAKI